MNIPNHVAIIPDGNRRWAKARGLEPWIGHEVGAKKTIKIIEEARRLGIKYFTLWIASFDNLTKRPNVEINFLCRVFVDYFKRLAKHPEIHSNKVKVRAYGALEKLFPEYVVRAVRIAEGKTANYGNYQLSFLMGYDGRIEMVEAVSKIVKEALQANPYPAPVTQELIQSHLSTYDLPPVDLVIRTGIQDAPHWSGGFLMWQIAYAQLYFTNTYYPDFSPQEFRKAIEDYSKRERRFGA